MTGTGQLLTREQGAILTLFTGIICGPVDDALELARIVLGRPVYIHELGSGPVFDEIQQLIRPLFEAIAPSPGMPDPIWPTTDTG